MGRPKASSSSCSDSGATAGHFTSGMEVEVKSEDEGFRGAWYEAVVMSCNPKKRSCAVQYTSLICDDDFSRNLEESVLVDNMRPRPPRDHSSFRLYDVVDAYHNDGWWGGVISEIRTSPDSEAVESYTVCFPATREVVYFKPEEVRPQLCWSRRRWIKMDEIEEEGRHGVKNAFAIGNPIEVTRDTEIYGAAWFTGKVANVISNSIFIVEYNELEKDTGERLKEIVHIQHIRPPPPQHAQLKSFQLQDEVEAFYKDRWYAGVVVKVISESKYAVRSKFLPNEECEFDISNLRPSRYWTNGKWVGTLQGKHKKSSSGQKLQAEISSPTITQELHSPRTINDNETEVPNIEGQSQTGYSMPSERSKKSKSSDDYFRLTECSNKFIACSESSTKPTDRKQGPPLESPSAEILKLQIEAPNFNDSELCDGLNGNQSNIECQASTDFSGITLNESKTDTPILERQVGFPQPKSKKTRTSKVRKLNPPIGELPILSHGLFDSKSSKPKKLPQKRKSAVSAPLQTKEMERLKQKKSMELVQIDENSESYKTDLSRGQENPTFMSNDMPQVSNCQGMELVQISENSDSAFGRTESTGLCRGSEKPTVVSNDMPQVFNCQGLPDNDMLVICQSNQSNISTGSPLQMHMGPSSTVLDSLNCQRNLRIDCSPTVLEKAAEKRNQMESEPHTSPAHEVPIAAKASFNFVEQLKLPGLQTIVESGPLPFTKNHPMWKYLETLDVFHSIPQEPHFRSLDQYTEEFREGMAIGLMVTFYNMVTKINFLNISDPESTYDGLLKGLATLENNGFDVQPLHSRIERLLKVKKKQAESLMGTETIKKKISNLLEQKVHVDCEVGALDKEVTELQELFTRLRDKREKAVMMAKSLESEITELHKEIEASTEVALLAENQFSALVSAPL